MEDTLQDDEWIDSFDKLLRPRQQLRELNVIKNSIRVSFNIDSSVENSNEAIESFERNHNGFNTANGLKKCCNRNCSISTPCSKLLDSDLFHCELSPIAGIKLNGFECNLYNLKDCEVKLDVKKKICFEINSNCKNNAVCPPVALQPGKWRKSLSSWRKTYVSGLNVNKCIIQRRTISARLSRSPSQGNKSVCATDLNEIVCDHEREVLKNCDQYRPLSFHSTYALTQMINPVKVGEGAYGEVFRCTICANKLNVDVVLKIIPIEGSIEINGEKQKSFAEILPEIIITKKMSSLQVCKNNCTIGFVNLHKEFHTYTCHKKSAYKPYAKL